jgi:hypothetical protein
MRADSRGKLEADMRQIVTLIVLFGALVAAQNNNIAGTWVLEMQGHQVGLGIEQDGATLTGTLVIMGQKILVEGEYADRSFTFVSAPDEPTKIKLSGRLKDDGTMEGDVDTRHGILHWKGERLKPPPMQ